MNVNVNVNVGVRVTVSARVSVSVNVCRGSFKCGGAGIARARRDLSNVVSFFQIHGGLAKSMWRPRADRGPGAGRFVRPMGPLPLCVVLLVQANRNDTSDQAIGPAAESTL